MDIVWSVYQLASCVVYCCDFCDFLEKVRESLSAGGAMGYIIGVIIGNSRIP